MVERKELAKIANLAMTTIPKYIHSIVLRGNDDFPKLGTCTYITIRNKTIGVTCAHVIHDTSHVWAGLPVLKRPLMVEEDIKFSEATKVEAIENSIDIALLDCTSIDFNSIQKEPYCFDNSESISFESTLKNLNTFSCFIGLWGKKTMLAPFNDGVVYAEFPLYFACGPIKSVQENLIICDFAEQEQIVNNSDKFSQLKDVKLTGGGRDLSGTSGSGLWIHNGENFILIGILLGPEPSKKYEQLIRFTPIWKLRDFLNSIQT